jgi:hypothetical protein
VLQKSLNASVTGRIHSPNTRRRCSSRISLAILVDAQKPKADDKAYNAAFKSLPDKPYDP